MSTERDLTRIVRSWLRDDEHESADRVLDTVLDQLDTTPQRGAASWPARRLASMNSTLKFGLAAVVVAVAALVGINYLTQSGTGGPGPVPPPPSDAPESTPSPTPEASLSGQIAPGQHVLFDGEAIEGMATLPVTITVAEAGWYGAQGEGIVLKNDTAGAPDGAGLIAFFGPLEIYGDPCEWDSTRPDAPSATVDEVITALAAQASRSASEPIDITVDGHAGKAITLHVPDDAEINRCDGGIFGSWGLPGDDRTPFRFHQDPGQIDEVWVVDVGGTLTTLDWTYYDGTPQTVVDELRAIVESATFEAP